MISAVMLLLLIQPGADSRGMPLSPGELLRQTWQAQQDYKSRRGSYAGDIEELKLKGLEQSTCELDLLYADERGFLVEAVDNLDGDLVLDTWVIDAQGNLVHEVDDRGDRRNVEETSREALRRGIFAEYEKLREGGLCGRACGYLETLLKRKYSRRIHAEVLAALVDTYANCLGQPDLARKRLQAAEKDGTMEGEEMVQALVTLAEGYKSLGEKKQAISVYEHIIDDYPNCELPSAGGVASSLAERELALLTQEREWLQESRGDLAQAVWRGLDGADGEALRVLASRTNFQVGYKGRNGDYAPFDLAIDSYLDYRGGKAIEKGRQLCTGDGKTCFLESRGYGGRHRFVYIILSEADGMWEWRGFIYGRMSGEEIEKAVVLPLTK